MSNGASPPLPALRLWLIILLAIAMGLGLIALATGPGSSVSMPPPALRAELTTRLGEPVDAWRARRATVGSMIYTFPESVAVRPSFTLRSSPGDALPSALLDRLAVSGNGFVGDGLYVMVTSLTGRVVYVARVSDPRVLRLERHTPSGPRVRIRSQRSGALDVRFPFVRFGALSLFEADASGNVTRVYMRVPLGFWAPSKGGRRFEVSR